VNEKKFTERLELAYNTINKYCKVNGISVKIISVPIEVATLYSYLSGRNIILHLKRNDVMTEIIISEQMIDHMNKRDFEFICIQQAWTGIRKLTEFEVKE